MSTSRARPGRPWIPLVLGLTILATMVLASVRARAAPGEKPIVVTPGKPRVLDPSRGRGRSGPARRPKLGDRRTRTEVEGLVLVFVPAPASKSTESKGTGPIVTGSKGTESKGTGSKGTGSTDSGKKAAPKKGGSTKSPAKKPSSKAKIKKNAKVEGLSARVEKNVLLLEADDSAGGRRFRVTVTLTDIVEEYRFASNGRRRSRQWVEDDKKKRAEELEVIVTLGTLPVVVVGVGDEVDLPIPEVIRDFGVGRSRSTRASAQPIGGRQIRVRGREAGRARFDISYRIGEEKFGANLDVRVREQPLVVPVALEAGGAKFVSKADLAKLIGVSEVDVVRVEVTGGGKSVCRVVKDDIGVRVSAAGEGEATAAVWLDGWARRGRKGDRYRARMALSVTVR